MRFILVVERRHLFPGLSPQGFLPVQALDLASVAPHLFFAERAYMETCSHYKQIIPYMVLLRGQGNDRRVVAYQRRGAHSEQRLGGLWSVGFGGHIEPLDESNPLLRGHDPGTRGRSLGATRSNAAWGLVQAAAMRELLEETGLDPGSEGLALLGYINSDREDVSSVHFGVVFRVALDTVPGCDEDILDRVAAQSEPHRALWMPASALSDLLGPRQAPDCGTFEDWSRLVIDSGCLIDMI